MLRRVKRTRAIKPRTALTSRTRPCGMCQTGGAHFGAANGSRWASTATFSPGRILRNSHDMIDISSLDCPEQGFRGERGGRRYQLTAAPPYVQAASAAPGLGVALTETPRDASGVSESCDWSVWIRSHS